MTRIHDERAAQRALRKAVIERVQEGAGSVWLCLSGGNALGAYQAGAYKALFENGIEPCCIAGASIGAITGALIVGNTPEQRLERLREFWSVARQWGSALYDWSPLNDGRSEKQMAAVRTMLTGRPGLFHPSLPGLWSLLPGMPNDVRLFDTGPLRKTLKTLIDFDLLNRSPTRLIITAVDVETGEDVAFDNHLQALEVDHIMASTAFPVAFPPITVAGRTLLDPAVSANLPLRALFSEMPEDDVTCLCFDVVPQRGGIPQSIEEALGRAFDLLFACQSKHALHDIQLRHSLAREGAPGIRLIHVDYSGEGAEVALKAFDYSKNSLNQRWEVGHSQTALALKALANLAREPGAFRAWRLTGTGLMELG